MKNKIKNLTKMSGFEIQINKTFFMDGYIISQKILHFGVKLT